jgi:hypothetical protein
MYAEPNSSGVLAFDLWQRVLNIYLYYTVQCLITPYVPVILSCQINMIHLNNLKYKE